MSSISLENVDFNIGDKKILKDVSLHVKEGEMISLLGPSGCGKTTTLRVIGGLLRPQMGKVYLSEADVTSVATEKRGAVIVFQDYLLFPHLTVEENIAFGLKMRREKKSEIKKRVDYLMNLIQMKGSEKKYPQNLSGGQRQRVAIARALAVSPKVLLLDEPFSSLDSNLRHEMREFIRELQKKLLITTVLVTHDKEEALMTSDRVAVMLDGKIIQYDTPENIYRHPKNIEVADFLGEKNYFKGNIKSYVFSNELGDFETMLEEKKNVTAMIHPEDIRLSQDLDCYKIKGIISGKKYGGNRSYYDVTCKDIAVKVIADSSSFYKEGEKVSLDIDFKNACYF